MIELDKAYDSAKAEPEISQLWEQSGYNNPDNLPDRADLSAEDQRPYTIVLPPPNVTGTLHTGHALMLVVEDTLIRYHRMRGRKTLWLPGTDHAAIATQSKVEKLLQKEGVKNRHELGREPFLERVRAYAQDSHDTIVNQIKRMGASIDWSREAYTLDDKRNLAVRTAFTKLYDLGLIYRGHRIVNWDVRGQTTISDDEIVYESRKAELYTFRYSANFPIPIATTRPETKVGDTAVAVHPDSKYKEYIGQTFVVENFCGARLEIRIIGDESVDPDYGTGALGVTPAHSHADWDMAQKNNLPSIQVIDERGRMTATAGEILQEQKVAEARTTVVEWLTTNGLMEKVETIDQNVSTAERTGGIIEPLPKLQWFIDVNKEFALPHSELSGLPSGSIVTLKQLMQHVLDSGEVKIVPDQFEKTYMHWVNNLRDWCISRQIWFGHRIPVWYRGEDIYVGVDAPDGEDWMQDEDTLDTWFSSGLWTFSTLGWPEQTPDLAKYHPTDVLETGYDILFFWVARMILMTTSLTGQIPFRQVFLHGLVRDKDKKKMSKSLGNVIDPLDMIEKYGTDALRFALIFGTAPGTDMALAEEKIKGMKHFANKLWNVSRFILGHVDPGTVSTEFTAITEADAKILEQLAEVQKALEEHMLSFRLHEVAQHLYRFVWNELADVYIEASKAQLENTDEADNTKAILYHCLTTSLKLLHPMMPFVTEKLWQQLGHKQLLMVTPWPK